VGAWIETASVPGVFAATLSRPAWARGLKLDITITYTGGTASRPAWARGLKHL